jgi:Domain of unknown function (DUF4956)
VSPHAKRWDDPLIQAQIPPSADVDSILRANSQTSFFFEGQSDLGGLLLNLVIGVVLGLALQWHFRRYSSTLGGREQLAKVFPTLILTTLIIITIVKSSLALSLGLVGALSIVRFRTPIKEPEELVYLFLCIAAGLGLGASQTVFTVVGISFVLIAAALISGRAPSKTGKSIYLSLEFSDGDQSAEHVLARANALVSANAKSVDLRRFDAREGIVEINYLISFGSGADTGKMLGGVRAEFPSVGVSIVDDSGLPSV